MKMPHVHQTFVTLERVASISRNCVQQHGDDLQAYVGISKDLRSVFL